MTIRSLAVGALIVSALVLTGCAGPAVGVVDSRRILNESLPALTFQRQLDDRERAMAADLRLLAGRMSKADLEARRQGHLRELQELKGELESQLNEQVRKAVEEVARARRIRVVLVKEATSFGGVDVTQDVLDQLK
jgi:Skp family chaperone for outer membrane proteins